jgi:MarR family transcriptional regulator, lower aerobic nicotinate degradation pathway regulator
MDDLYRMPGHLVRRVQQISSAIFAEECAGFDITSVQFAALFAIEANPDIDATRLSHLVAFDRSTLGDVLERMETKGWIVRSATPSDRRIKLVRLTPAGEALLAQVMPAVERVQERLLAPLAPGDRAAMVRLLAQIAQVHNDVTPAPLRVAVGRS